MSPALWKIFSKDFSSNTFWEVVEVFIAQKSQFRRKYTFKFKKGPFSRNMNIQGHFTPLSQKGVFSPPLGEFSEKFLQTHFGQFLKSSQTKNVSFRESAYQFILKIGRLGY